MSDGEGDVGDDQEEDRETWSQRDLDSKYDYERVPIPDDRSPDRYTAAERRAELYGMIREAGHPAALTVSQQELGGRYGVVQQTISHDIELLRQYRAELVGQSVIATTEFVAERAVRGEIESGNFAQALYAQLRYADFLFDIGELDREPDRVAFESDDGEAYMAMLRAQAAREAENDEEPEHDPIDVGEFDAESDDPFDGDGW
jgi:hypothetical protein